MNIFFNINFSSWLIILLFIQLGSARLLQPFEVNKNALIMEKQAITPLEYQGNGNNRDDFPGDSCEGCDEDETIPCLLDCELQCVNADVAYSWLGDAYCDDGTYGMYLYCEEFGFDWGDCGGCPTSYLQDCNGECLHLSIINYNLDDGECDYGKEGPNLNCEEYDFDNDDCGDFCEQQGLLEDCDGTCFDEYYLGWIGDGYCDGIDALWGLNLFCAEYSWDGGDCGPPDCGALVADCNYNCFDPALAVDDICQNNYSPDANFYCEEFNYDNGACGYPDCNGDPFDEPLDELIGDGVCHDGEDGEPQLNCFYFNWDGEDCPHGPDLIIDANYLAQSTYIDTVTSTDECYVEEGCVGGLGERRVLRFSTMVANIGNEDFVLGSAGNGEGWSWHGCHNHYHYEDYAYYQILKLPCLENLNIGHKNGWCVMDLAEYGGDGIPCVGQYNCSNQGITSGCADIYHSGLDCQWLDITGMEDGEYILRVITNPDANLFEINYQNNAATAAMRIEQNQIELIGAQELEEILADCCEDLNENGICDAEEYSPGDVNMDGTVNVSDIVIIVGYILGTQELTDTQLFIADLNNDGEINVGDIVAIVAGILG